MHSSRKHEAERVRIGVVAGWLPVQAAVDWADRVIAEDAQPEPAVLDVSLAGRLSRSEVAALLGLVHGSADPIAVRKEALADLLAWVGDDVERGAQAARHLYEMATSGVLPEAEFGWEPYALDDDYDLAQKGMLGTVEESLKEVREYLERIVRS